MYAAYLQDSAGHKVPLQEGINSIGRGSDFLKDCLGRAYAEDLRISRRHAEIHFSKQTGSLVLSSLGTNPVKYFPSTANAQAELIFKGKSKVLRDGDSIQLLDGVYTLKVIVVQEMPRESINLADPEPLDEIIPYVASPSGSGQNQQSPKGGKNQST